MSKENSTESNPSFDISKISEETHSEFLKNKFYKSIIQKYKAHKHWWNKTEKIFSEIALSSNQLQNRQDHTADWTYEKYCMDILSNPEFFKSFGLWALYQAVCKAEMSFLKDCSTPHIEVSLTACIIKELQFRTEEIQNKYRDALIITDTHISCSKLELQVQNREKYTGGDFGLLLEWKDSDGSINICPIIFQAKRYVGDTVSLTQENKETGLQLETLQKSNCNPVYLFYNCDTKGTTSYPTLPTVKIASDIVRTFTIHGEKSVSSSILPAETSPVQQVLSLSTFVLDITSNPKHYNTTSDRTTALGEMLSTAQECELAHIITISTDSNAASEYYETFKHLNHVASNKKKSKNTHSAI